jgi:hypothetical protein
MALLSGAYVPNEYGKWYGLLSIGFRKLFVSEVSSQIYILWNIEDRSAVLSSTLFYNPVDEVQSSLGLVWYTGKDKQEYTSTDFPVVLTAQFSLKF